MSVSGVKLKNENVMVTGSTGTKRILGVWLLALSFLSFFAACDEDEDLGESTYLWTPAINLEKGDGEATLFLADPTPFSLYVSPGPSRPSHFTVMISEDLENFSEYQTVDVETTSLLIKDLINGKPYYFFVTAHRNRFPSVQTDTLMTIPSVPFERYSYTQSPEGPFERFSTSFDQSFGLYRVNDKYYQFRSSDPDFVNLVDDQTYYASWASNSNQLVYLEHTIVGSVAYPSSINMHDPEEQSSTTLLTIPYERYIVGHPLFTPDGSKITFLSTEDNAADHIYDLWSIDLTTNEKRKLSDFEGAGFITNNSFAWDKSGEAVYLAGGFTVYDTDIYKFDFATKVLSPVISSKWSDKIPKMSPDGNSIAFVSNRSGQDELWLYNLTTSQYSQITGEPGYELDTRYSEIQWLDNETLLISVIEDTRHVVINMKVSQ
jgi:hypothetical protein